MLLLEEDKHLPNGFSTTQTWKSYEWLINNLPSISKLFLNIDNAIS